MIGARFAFVRGYDIKFAVISVTSIELVASSSYF